MSNQQLPVQGMGSIYIDELGNIHVHHETVCSNPSVCDAAAARVNESLGLLGATVVEEITKRRAQVPATQAQFGTVEGEQVDANVDTSVQQRLYRQQ